jgi:hypothetical protein
VNLALKIKVATEERMAKEIKSGTRPVAEFLKTDAENKDQLDATFIKFYNSLQKVMREDPSIEKQVGEDLRNLVIIFQRTACGPRAGDLSTSKDGCVMAEVRRPVKMEVSRTGLARLVRTGE